MNTEQLTELKKQSTKISRKRSRISNKLSALRPALETGKVLKTLGVKEVEVSKVKEKIKSLESELQELDKDLDSVGGKIMDIEFKLEEEREKKIEEAETKTFLALITDILNKAAPGKKYTTVKNKEGWICSEEYRFIFTKGTRQAVISSYKEDSSFKADGQVVSIGLSVYLHDYYIEDLEDGNSSIFEDYFYDISSKLPKNKIEKLAKIVGWVFQ